MLGVRPLARTANGDAWSWTAVLDEVDFGDLEAHRVRDSVLSIVPSDQVLLGMS